MKKNQTTQVVAEISLYGIPECGHGTIIRLADGFMSGDGEPMMDRSATAAVWLATDEIGWLLERRGQKITKRSVALVHYDFPQGPKVATVPMLGPQPYFGDLVWTDGPMYELSAKEG